MHPDIESFLEDAFSSVQPTSPKIGRVVVEPDYEADPDPADASLIAAQLADCIAAQPINEKALASVRGFDIAIGREYPSLAKYLRCITLHAAGAGGAWVEVAPPGNWI